MTLGGYFSRVDFVFFRTEKSASFEFEDGFFIHEISGRTRGRGAKLPWMRRFDLLRTGIQQIELLADEVEPDLIGIGEPFLSGIVGRRVARKRGLPLYLTLVSNYDLSYRAGGSKGLEFLPYGLVSALEKRVISQCDLVLTDRQYYADYAQRRGASSELVKTAPVWVDPIFYGSNPDPNIWERLGIQDPLPLVYVGRLSPEKYCLDLLEALQAVTRARPRTTLVIFGGGPQAEEFLKEANEKGLGNNLHLVAKAGPHEIFSGMAGAGAVLATHAGYSLLEAALAAAPIVAYDFEWHPEVVADRETGLLVPYRDARGLGEAALELLTRRLWALQLGSNARVFGLDKHQPERSRAEQVAALEGLLAKHDLQRSQ